ncbi:LPS assembly protein LptD [Thalassotalea euphylliae]|uniref:LPS-assembly protein LptD n=1 Tax=Thalassotalea euphylliae TaxID=1655234 RepID=A0A3E0UJK1_9GAMM|nr:LPS assembly protein LptD [Thalassotalea euphylliae]REL36807.1 LPS-assembly protein LptD [Thalassotalea euphylliae]
MPFPTKKLLLASSCYLIVSPAIAQQTAEAPTGLICPLPEFDVIQAPVQAVEKDSISISSRTTSIEKDQVAVFRGGVTLVKDDQKISADEIAFDRLKAQINASGTIHFQNSGVNVFANQLSASEADNSTALADTSYYLADNPGHGSAGKLVITADGNLALLDSTFTTCHGEVPDWQIKASAINISVAENQGEAYNARLELFEVPVLYVPYFSFPVTNERKSGLLEPTFKSSGNSGVQIELPYYLNLAENYDATITPRYMSKRGLQLLTEFRYLVDDQFGQIDLEYLHKDDEIQTNNDARYLWRYQHIGNFSENFRAHIDYTSISDDNYLVDIGSSHYNDNDAYLYQLGELAYFGENWQALIKLQDFEVLGNHTPSYKTVPQVEFSSATPLGLFDASFDVYSELSRFESPNPDLVEANRYHIEAGFNVPITTPAYFFNSEFKVLNTYYDQEQVPLGSELEESVTRTLPKVRFHGGVNFDREAEYFGNSFTQTLEPQLQYLYISDKDQNNIGLYDTARLQDDFQGLFRDRRFSGLDRIAQANQYSWGLTSRLLDEANVEQFRMSLGRIVYLNDSNIAADDARGISADKSSLAADLFVRGNEQWQFSGNIQYNTETDTTNKSQVNVDYRQSRDNIFQINHRYSRDVSGVSIEQLSLLSSVRINPEWQFVGRFTQDLQQKRSLESYAGFQYESCCWAVRIAYHRHINSNVDSENFGIENRDEFNSGFVLEFVIKGFGGQTTTVGTQDMFNSSIFGYKRPYFLNN